MNTLTSCALQKKYCMIQEFLPSKEVSTTDFISLYIENRDFRLENASLLQHWATFGRSFLQYGLLSQQILRYRVPYELAQKDALASVQLNQTVNVDLESTRKVRMLLQAVWLFKLYFALSITTTVANGEVLQEHFT